MKLPESVFGLGWNSDLVHQVITSLETSKRSAIAHAKGRGEVSGGGKKPWKQKGTGRARHGSIRSPIWKGGGVAHGPNKEENFTRKVNKKMKTKALFTILSRKAREEKVVLLDSLKHDAPKTKEAAATLKNLSAQKGMSSLSWKNGSRALVLLPNRDTTVKRSFRNIPSVEVEEIRNINPVDALKYQYVVFVNPESTLKMLADKLA